MTSLSILPIEILECITGTVTTSGQMRMWQCGDRTLNYKLKKGGLKRTSLCWSGWAWMPWPRWYFTTFDSIVDVKWCMAFGRSLCPTFELNLLPKTLKHLHLACDDVFILLRKQNINMNDLLPMLHTLRLSGLLLREENLKNLPTNLVELYVDSLDDWIESSTIFGDLPRSLQRLTLLFRIIDPSKLENHLPSDLISLNIRSISADFNWFSKLPKLLKSLKMDEIGFRPDWLTLPFQLEELALFVPESEIPHLPRSLKSLTLPEEIGELEEIIPLLPTQLSKIHFSHPIGIPIEHSVLQQLPASITDYGAIVSTTHPDIVSLFHPETIRICLGAGPHASELNLIPFPTTLQCLSIHYINDDICALLPPGLQELDFEDGHITAKGASHFPMSLTYLSAHFKVFDTDQTMSYLGRIANLHLITDSTKPRNFSEEWISSLLPSAKTPGNSEDDYLYDSAKLDDCCNHNLTSLVVRGFKWQVNRFFVQESFFRSLPKFKNLNSLEIGFRAGISSDWLCFIPQNVTRLQIHALDTYPTVTQLSRLPKRLIYLELVVEGEDDLECDWDDETLQALPRSLQSCTIKGSFPKLTHGLYKYLPPNLRETSICYSISDFTFSDPLDRMYGENILNH